MMSSALDTVNLKVATFFLKISSFELSMYQGRMIVEFPSGSYMECITVSIQTKENPEGTLIELF